jgi:hypothetical protein
MTKKVARTLGIQDSRIVSRKLKKLDLVTPFALKVKLLQRSKHGSRF